MLSVPNSNGVIATEEWTQNLTGWQQITDATYTVGSPLTIATGVTGKIQTGSITTIDTQLPDGVTTFWNNTTDKLVAVNNGDAFTLSLRFKLYIIYFYLLSLQEHKVSFLFADYGSSNAAAGINGIYQNIFNRQTGVVARKQRILHRIGIYIQNRRDFSFR